MEDLRYPIGQYKVEGEVTKGMRDKWIQELADTPAKLREAVAGLTEDQLDTPYRPDGWTVRQVVHHIPDSHLNAYIRFKWALTEDAPTIKAYDEVRWAELPEAKSADIDVSLTLLEAVHARLDMIFKNMSDADFERVFTHPETGESPSLAVYLGLYAWHGKHHIAHINRLRERRGW